tara:strand:- start:172 stop:768 length:597 start_codon:yes stop_codon:yes gene_type:complete
MNFDIRRYHITDLSSLYKICLLTGYNGNDATPFLKDTDLVGHLFAAPYAFFEPDLCFILVQNSIPSGYILGTRDSMRFYEQCEKNWFPKLRERYPLSPKKNDSLESIFLQYLHQNHNAFEWSKSYPAHLHIDILPNAQGKGYGRKLIETFFTELQSQNIQGVHLIVSKSNQNAIGFYQQIGLQKLQELDESIVFGKKL